MELGHVMNHPYQIHFLLQIFRKGVECGLLNNAYLVQYGKSKKRIKQKLIS